MKPLSLTSSGCSVMYLPPLTYILFISIPSEHHQVAHIAFPLEEELHRLMLPVLHAPLLGFVDHQMMASKLGPLRDQLLRHEELLDLPCSVEVSWKSDHRRLHLVLRIGGVSLLGLLLSQSETEYEALPLFRLLEYLEGTLSYLEEEDLSDAPSQHKTRIHKHFQGLDAL